MKLTRKKKELLKQILVDTSVIALFMASTVLLSAFTAQLYESYLYSYKGSSVVMLTQTAMARRGGTGFQITAPSGQKYILTNAHICKIAPSLVAHTQMGLKKRVKVIEIDKKHDLCIMQPIIGLRSLKIASDIVFRERVWLVGHPALRPLTLESGHFTGNVMIKLWEKCDPKMVTKQLNEYNKKRKKRKDMSLGGILRDLETIMKLSNGFCIVPYSSQHINNISYGGNSGSPVMNKFGNVVGVLYAGRRDQPTASHTVPLKEIHRFLRNK